MNENGLKPTEHAMQRAYSQLDNGKLKKECIFREHGLYLRLGVNASWKYGADMLRQHLFWKERYQQQIDSAELNLNEAANRYF